MSELIPCPECSSSHVVKDEDMGEFICNKCGLVIREDMLDQSPEWRAFTIEEREAKRRVGPPTDYTRYDKGLSTAIWMTRDSFGRRLPSKTKQQMWRLRRWQIRSGIQGKSRNLLKAMNVIQRLSEKLHVPSSVQKTASIFYRRVLDKDLVRGRCIASLAAASLYAACRFTETPRSLKEVAETSLRDRKEIARGYRILVRRLKINMPIHDPSNCLSKVAEKAGTSGAVQGLAMQILREAKQKHITAGKDPRGVAATVLYIACQHKGQKMTQKEIADAADVTEVTIRNRKRELMERLDI
jgi:transcription initiation factor TFIIB